MFVNVPHLNRAFSVWGLRNESCDLQLNNCRDPSMCRKPDILNVKAPRILCAPWLNGVSLSIHHGRVEWRHTHWQCQQLQNRSNSAETLFLTLPHQGIKPIVFRFEFRLSNYWATSPPSGTVQVNKWAQPPSNNDPFILPLQLFILCFKFC